MASFLIIYFNIDELHYDSLSLFLDELKSVPQLATYDKGVEAILHFNCHHVLHQILYTVQCIVWLNLLKEFSTLLLNNIADSYFSLVVYRECATLILLL